MTGTGETQEEASQLSGKNFFAHHTLSSFSFHIQL